MTTKFEGDLGIEQPNSVELVMIAFRLPSDFNCVRLEMNNAKGGGAVNADSAEAVLTSMIGPREQVPINNMIV